MGDLGDFLKIKNYISPPNWLATALRAVTRFDMPSSAWHVLGMTHHAHAEPGQQHRAPWIGHGRSHAPCRACPAHLVGLPLCSHLFLPSSSLFVLYLHISSILLYLLFHFLSKILSSLFFFYIFFIYLVIPNPSFVHIHPYFYYPFLNILFPTYLYILCYFYIIIQPSIIPSILVAYLFDHNLCHFISFSMLHVRSLIISWCENKKCSKYTS